MKKLLTLLLLTTLLISCSSDDDPEVNQGYTSFVVWHNESVNFKNAVAGYLKDGKYTKLGNLGDLTKGKQSNEIRVDDKNITQIYVFSDYPDVAYKLDTIFILKNNTKNIFQINRYTKGILVDPQNSSQYPQ